MFWYFVFRSLYSNLMCVTSMFFEKCMECAKLEKFKRKMFGRGSVKHLFSNTNETKTGIRKVEHASKLQHLFDVLSIMFKSYLNQLTGFLHNRSDDATINSITWLQSCVNEVAAC
jgi:hypothetical protein